MVRASLEDQNHRNSNRLFSLLKVFLAAAIGIFSGLGAFLSPIFAEGSSMHFGYLGSAEGNLKATSNLGITMNPFFWGMDYQIPIDPQSSYSLGVVINICDARYVVDGLTKEGVYESYGGALGYVYDVGNNVGAHALFELYPYSKLAVNSYFSATINDQLYEGSQLSVYQGNLGFKLKLNLYYMYTKWPFTSNTFLRLGFSLGYLYQLFQVRSDKVETTTYRESSSKSGNYPLTMTETTVYLGLTRVKL